MNFLSAELVRKDLIRFSKGIADMYGIEHVEVYIEEQEEANKLNLGYSFLRNGERAIIKMPYFCNELGELAVDEANKVWTVEYQETISSGHKTIGDALEVGLGIPRVNTKKS